MPKNFWYFSGSSCAISWNMEMALRTSFFWMTPRVLDCWRTSRDTLRSRSSESTMPWMKLRYLGIMSSKSSVMNTRLTKSLRGFFSRLPPKRLSGAEEGGENRKEGKVWYPPPGGGGGEEAV